MAKASVISDANQPKGAAVNTKKRRGESAIKIQRAKVPTAPPQYHDAPLLETEADMLAATQALRALDPEPIGRMLDVAGPIPLRRRTPGFAGLVAIIVSQQVSVASANAIEARLHAGLVPFLPETVLTSSDDELRSCGLSGPKMRSLRALSDSLVSGQLDLAALATMTPEDAHGQLVKVKGIGPWSADIFLMFCLGHPDAFAQGDLALQEAARLAFDLDTRPDAAALHSIAEKWRPYRGVAARLLWAYYKVRKERAGLGV